MSLSPLPGCLPRQIVVSSRISFCRLFIKQGGQRVGLKWLLVNFGTLAAKTFQLETLDQRNSVRLALDAPSLCSCLSL